MARAQQNALCDKWYNDWGDETDVDGLLEKFVAGQDFCINNDYPPLDFIRKNFKKDDLHRHNIFLDEEVNLTDANSGDYVFLGKCSGKIVYSGFKVSSLYLRHESALHIVAKDASRVFVSLYGQSDCKTDGSSFCKLKIYDHRKGR